MSPRGTTDVWTYIQCVCVCVSLPFVDMCPGSHHVIVDLSDLVRVVVGVQCQQFVSECVGSVHLTLSLLQLLHKELERDGGTGRKEDRQEVSHSD